MKLKLEWRQPGTLVTVGKDDVVWGTSELGWHERATCCIEDTDVGIIVASLDDPDNATATSLPRDQELLILVDGQLGWFYPDHIRSAVHCRR